MEIGLEAKATPGRGEAETGRTVCVNPARRAGPRWGEVRGLGPEDPRTDLQGLPG